MNHLTTESLELSHKPLYGIVLIIIPIAIVIWMLFDEFIMRRRPYIGVILAALSLIGVTIVILSKTVQSWINVDEFTTFMIIKSYLLCIPATLLPIFRCIHGSEAQFNTFKKYICCNLKCIQHKSGHPQIIAVILYIFLVSNIAEAVIFEFLAPWKDMRDEFEREHNKMSGFAKWTCLLNAISGFLVIIMIPLPTRKNWFLFSETVKERRRNTLTQIITTKSTESNEYESNYLCFQPDPKKDSSARFNDLLMVLNQNDSTLSKVFSYSWIFVYSSWNWLFTVRYLGAGSVIDGAVHIFPPILRAFIYQRSDLWLQSRLHVLWSTLIFWIPFAKVTMISKRTEDLNQDGLTVWSLMNAAASLACFWLFIRLKRWNFKSAMKKASVMSPFGNEESKAQSVHIDIDQGFSSPVDRKRFPQTV